VPSHSWTVLYRSLMKRHSSLVLKAEKRNLKDCCGAIAEDHDSMSGSYVQSIHFHTLSDGPRYGLSRIDFDGEFSGVTRGARRSKKVSGLLGDGCKANRAQFSVGR